MTKENFNLLIKGARVVTNQRISFSPKLSIPKGTIGVVHTNEPEINSRDLKFDNFGVCRLRFDEVDLVNDH